MGTLTSIIYTANTSINNYSVNCILNNKYFNEHVHCILNYKYIYQVQCRSVQNLRKQLTFCDAAIGFPEK